MTETGPQNLWRGFNIKQEKSTREAIKRELKDRYENFKGEISKKELAEKLDASPETVRRQAKKLKHSGEIKEVERKDSQRTFYIWKSDEDKVSEDDEYLNKIKRAHKEAVNIWGGLRQPKLEEVAYVGMFDSEDQRFRKAYHHLLRKQDDWSKPLPADVKWETYLRPLVANAKMVAIGETDRVDPNIHGKGFSVEEYAEKNEEILKDVKVTRLGGRDDEIIIGLELPKKLFYFTGARMLGEDHLKSRKHMSDSD